VKRLLLIGAGHAHLGLLQALAQGPLYGAATMIVTPEPLQVYSGMLPGVIAGHYRLEQAQIDVARLAERAQVEFLQGEVASLDAKKRVVRLRDWTELEYDVVSINAGSLAERSLPGARLALPVKPFGELVSGLTGAKRVAVAGAGPAGAELAMALRNAGAVVTLYSEKPAMPAALAQRVLRQLRRRGVDFRPGMAVTAIDPGPVVVAGTTHQEFDRVLLATGASAPPWLRASGLETDERGFALVQRTLQSTSHLDVFVVGDCATLRDAPHAKSGVYAVRHGETLAQNLRNLVAGLPLVPFKPQPRALSLLSCGARYAIAEWGGWTAEGRWVWWWKDRIDRRWIKSFSS
jgi:pyridine nucleotide-disulfide oxidoreductase family protein